MKQHITVDTINKELTDKGRQELLNWAIPKLYLTARENYLTIGQMIEFLDEQPEERLEIFAHGNGWVVEVDLYNKQDDTELCDALWQAVKKVLEND